MLLLGMDGKEDDERERDQARYDRNATLYTRDKRRVFARTQHGNTRMQIEGDSRPDKNAGHGTV